MHKEKTFSNSDYPLISVIVPVFNGEAFIGACLDSLFAQTYPNIEVIVVNDGSNDNSMDVIKQYPVDISLIQSNQGPSSARNTGIKASNGQLLAFLDADDTYPPNKLIQQYNLLRKHPDVDLVRGLVQYQFEENSNLQLKENYIDDQLKIKFGPNVGAFLIRKKVFNRVGLFDERIPTCEDIDFWRRIIFYEINYLNQSKISLHYRIHNHNLIGDTEKMRKGIIRFCKNEISRKVEKQKRSKKKQAIVKELLMVLKENKPISSEISSKIDTYTPTEFAETFHYFLPFLQENKINNYPLLDKRAIGVGRKNWVQFNKISLTLSPIFQWLKTHSLSYCYLGAFALANYYTKKYFRSSKVHHFYINVTDKDLVSDWLKTSFPKTVTIQKHCLSVQELNLSIKFYFMEKNHPFLQSQKLQQTKDKSLDFYFTTLKPLPYLRHLLNNSPTYPLTLVLMDIAVILRHLKINQNQLCNSQDLDIIQQGEKAIQLADLSPSQLN